MKVFSKHSEEFRRNIWFCILSGVLLGFSFPPSPFGILACVGLIPLLLVLENVEKTRSALGYVYVAMLIFHIITLNWTGGYAHMNDPYMMIAGALTMFLHPLFYFLPFAAFLFVKRHSGWARALMALPFAWVTYEYSHTLSEWSFPWLTLGNSQSYAPARIQFIEYTGVIGLSLWILILNVLGYFLYESILRDGVTLRSRMNVTLAGTMLLIFILPTIYGSLILFSKEQKSTQASSTVTVGMIQANVDPWEKWKKTGTATIDEYIHMTRELVRNNPVRKPDIVLWPETAVPYAILLPRNRPLLNSIRDRLDTIGVSVLTGLRQIVFYEDTLTAPPSAKRISETGERWDDYNATAYIQPGVEDIPWYGKMKMVPLAERIPYADAFYAFDFLRWGVGVGGWQLGRDTVIFQEKNTGARFCSMICYESVYPEFVSSFVKKGAEFITIVTIDSWWDHMSGAYQHHQYAIFRAVENRRWIARCAVGGFSSYIDPYGKVYDKTELFTQATLNRTIERRTDLTFYTQHGEWLSKICVMVAALFFILAIANKIQNKKRTV